MLTKQEVLLGKGAVARSLGVCGDRISFRVVFSQSF